MGLDSLGNRRTPERRTPLMGGLIVERLTPTTLTMITAGISLTAAQLFTKYLLFNSSDNGNLTLPTAAQIMAGCPGLDVGDAFEFVVQVYGNHTVTVVVNTGITNKSIDSETSILTIATHNSKRFALICTAKANPSDPTTSDAFDLVGFGTTVATA